jgi:hypothetical protein
MVLGYFRAGSAAMKVIRKKLRDRAEGNGTKEETSSTAMSTSRKNAASSSFASSSKSQKRGKFEFDLAGGVGGGEEGAPGDEEEDLEEAKVRFAFPI